MIKVSIVIPVFNCAGSLRECLSGLKLIATREIQVVVVDDGSTDQSPLVALGFREEFENFTYQRISENKGVGNARNIGLELSVGTYIYFLDCDDAVSGNFSDSLMSELSAKSDLVFTPVSKMPSGIFNSSFLTFLAQQPNFGREHLLSSLEKFEAWPLECWGYFIRRDFLLDNQISFEPIRISEDMVFMTAVFSKLNSYSIVQDFVYIHYRTPGSLGKSFSNHDIESWFSAFLGLSNLAKEVPIGSSESRVIVNRLSYTFAYVLVSFLLIGPLGKKDFSIWVTDGERTDLLHRLEFTDTDQTHAKFNIFGKFLEEMSINIEKLLNPVGQGKTYLYCYDRLSLGIFEILKSLNFKVNGIVDDQCGGVIASTDFGTSPISPETLYEELIENDTVVICHDKHSVFTSKQQELQSLQKRGIRVIRFTTRDLVGDLPFEKLFKKSY